MKKSPFIIRICNSRVSNFVYSWWATISTCFLWNGCLVKKMSI